MSCQDCDDFQHGDKTSFFRWKNANIEIRACRKHLSEVFDVLREASLTFVSRENVANIAQSEIFMVMWNDHIKNESVPILQMGYALYFDKPIMILSAKSRESSIPENLKRVARSVEIYDDSLPREAMMQDMKTATLRGMQAAGLPIHDEDIDSEP